MSARDVLTTEIEDVNGSFSRLCTQSPKQARKLLSVVVKETAARLAPRMAEAAPEGPDAPHIKDTVTFSHRGLFAQVGYLEQDFGGEPAGDDTDATIAEVALYNEYAPDHQPFMDDSAQKEAPSFASRAAAALASLEEFFGIGG